MRQKWGNCWNFRHGYLPMTVAISNINKDNFKEFISDKDYRIGAPYNGVFSPIIDNKLYLPMLLKDYLEYVPTYYYYKDKYGFLPLEKGKSHERANIDDFFALVDEKKAVVLKHTHQSVGRGFFLVKKEGEGYTLNGKPSSREKISQIVNPLDEYIVTEYVKQHQYSSEIAPSSVNTIRITCFWDDEKKEFFVASALHRFGCNGLVVDNAGAGGAWSCIDPNTGVMSGIGQLGSGYSQDVVHPDSNIRLRGVAIPQFNEVKSKLLEICNSISFLRFLGFDVVITDDGFKILEINSRPQLYGSQHQKGFLSDPRIRKVLKKSRT